MKVHTWGFDVPVHDFGKEPSAQEVMAVLDAQRALKDWDLPGEPEGTFAVAGKVQLMWKEAQQQGLSFHVEATLGVAGFKPDVHAEAMSRAIWAVVYEPGLRRHIISTLVEKELARRGGKGESDHGR
jgi:hypothetical protein